MKDLTKIAKKTMEDMSEKYKVIDVEEARQCYTQYVGRIIEDVPKKDRQRLLNYWNELITSD